MEKDLEENVKLDLSDLDLSELDTFGELSMERLTTGVGATELEASIGWNGCCTCCLII
jgi:hypothetical protein